MYFHPDRHPHPPHPRPHIQSNFVDILMKKHSEQQCDNILLIYFPYFHQFFNICSKIIHLIKRMAIISATLLLHQKTQFKVYKRQFLVGYFEKKLIPETENPALFLPTLWRGCFRSGRIWRQFPKCEDQAIAGEGSCRHRRKQCSFVRPPNGNN